MSTKSALFSRVFLIALVALLHVLDKSVHSWPLTDGGVDASEMQDSNPIHLLRELKQRQADLKEKEAYNEHLESILFAMALNNAKSATNENNDDSEFDSRQLYRASRSHGKPTFIRFGKRSAPSFIRFGKRDMEEQSAPMFGAKNRQEETLSDAKLTKSKI